MTLALQAYIWFLLVDAVARGVDYLTGPPENLDFLTDDDLGMPHVWGAALLVSSVIVAYGLVRKKLTVVQFGSVVSAAVYFMLAFQMFEGRMLPFPWPPEDVRVVATQLSAAGMWAVSGATIWWREGIRKRCEEAENSQVRSG